MEHKDAMSGMQRMVQLVMRKNGGNGRRTVRLLASQHEVVVINRLMDPVKCSNSSSVEDGGHLAGGQARLREFTRVASRIITPTVLDVLS